VASVFVCSTAEQMGIFEGRAAAPLKLLKTLASQDSHGNHVLVADPESADLILFAEGHTDDALCGPYFDQVRCHPIFRRFHRKSVVISGMDRIIPLVSGIFASIEGEGRWHTIARSGPYLVEPNPFLRYEPLHRTGNDGMWLASFMGGSNTIPARRALQQIDDSRFCIRDTHDPFVGAVQNNRVEEEEKFKREFVNLSLNSRFILCPRGHGTSSFRLFEAMEMGRAPVIISDRWVEPDGVDWGAFAVRVSEKDIARLPSILDKLVPDAAEMGETARAAWEAHFSPGALFHYFVEQALAIRDAGLIARNVYYALAWLQLARPRDLRRNWRRFKTYAGITPGQLRRRRRGPTT
jgi:hypothetical protein